MKSTLHLLPLLIVGLNPALPESQHLMADDFTTQVSPPLFRYLASENAALIAYTPSRLDPRNPANQGQLRTSEIRADLDALRPHFDGLVLYGYHEACTPRIAAIARDLNDRALVLAIWDPRSAAEVDGVSALANQFAADVACGVIVGNEGLTFGRYEEDDLRFAHARLQRGLPSTVPVTTSEPLAGYEREFVRGFGDFLAPNIHPVFDRPALTAAAAAEWVRSEALRLARQSEKPFHQGNRFSARWTAYRHSGIHTGAAVRVLVRIPGPRETDNTGTPTGHSGVSGRRLRGL